jgi:putative endonuclease
VSAYLYILRCADGSYYVGTTRDSVEKRVGEHDAGVFDGYTARQRPVTLVFCERFEQTEDGVSAEWQVKGWRREKKEALIRDDFAVLSSLARRGSNSGSAPRSARPSRRAHRGLLRMRNFLNRSTTHLMLRSAPFETPLAAAPQDEGRVSKHAQFRCSQFTYPAILR